MSPDTSDREQIRCPKCKEPSTAGKKYCSDCGALLDPISATIRALVDEEVERLMGSKFKGERLLDLEVSVAVVHRVMGWAKQFAFMAGIPLALLVVVLAVLGITSYHDLAARIAAAEKKVNPLLDQSIRQAEQAEAVSEGAQKTAADAGNKAAEVSGVLHNLDPVVSSVRHELLDLRQTATTIEGEYRGLQSDIGRYREVNQSIEKLQQDVLKVQNQVVDLGKREFRADTLTATHPGPGSISLQIGCPPRPAFEHAVAYCVQGPPASFSLFQLDPTGEKRPVSSWSSVGFQDTSIAAKPTCNATNRGTIYVEKGDAGVADKPFLCAKDAANAYTWVQLLASR